MTDAVRSASLATTRASFNAGGIAIDSLKPANSVAFSRWLSNVVTHLCSGSFNRPGVRIPGFELTEDTAKADEYANRIGLSKAYLASERDHGRYAVGPAINLDEVERAPVHVIPPRDSRGIDTS